MPLGPGKYGARAAALLAEVDATMIVVITVGGSAGSAFDVATTDPRLTFRLPEILREVATNIERDLKAAAAEKQ